MVMEKREGMSQLKAISTYPFEMDGNESVEGTVAMTPAIDIENAIVWASCVVSTMLNVSGSRGMIREIFTENARRDRA